MSVDFLTPQPDGQASDGQNGTDLATYLDAVQFNVRAPTEVVPGCVRLADSTLVKAIEGLTPATHIPSARMLLFAHSALRQATVMTLSGGVGHVPAVQRQALEAAMYGLLFRYSPEMLKHWRKREEVPSSRRKFREGGLQAARAELQRLDRKLHANEKNLYESLLSLGAHPNVFPIEAAARYVQLDDGSYRLEHEYLCDGRSRVLPFIYSALVAECVLGIYYHVYPEVWDRLDISAERKAIVVSANDHRIAMSF